MPACPRCQQPVDTQAILCPYCRAPLKAHGHPGIPLYRATGSEPLCATCTYDEDDTCTFPKRPHAMDCTLYRDRTQLTSATQPGYSRAFLIKTWLRRNVSWLALLGLVLVSLLVTLLR